MREFVYDRLPRDISDYLPADAKTWQRTSGNELSRKGLARVRAGRGRTAGLVIHYDIMRPYARRFEHYANDPPIKELTAAGAALTVMTLAPNREVLLEQFLKRAADRDYVEWWDKKRWTRPLKRKLREALIRAFMTPEAIRGLSQFDAMLCLSVLHHVIRGFGHWRG
jgi:hypothetical protein